MPVRNQNWYNLQSTRRYPLDDISTGEADDGATIRDDIIVDCHIRFPSTFGRWAYIQGITITDNLVTIVVGAADDLLGTNSRIIAVISEPKPVSANVNLPLTPVRFGVSGWLVLGPGINTKFVARYTTPAQSAIGQRNARPYTNLPVPTLGRLGSVTALDGVIALIAESPISAKYYPQYSVPQYDPETDTTSNNTIKAIVIAGEAPSAMFNVYKEFLGPCAERPESGTCPKGAIERINGIQPDCDTGNINIVGDGISVRMFEECGGADITTNFGLLDACQEPDRQPRGKNKCPCAPLNNDDDLWCWPELNNDSGAPYEHPLVINPKPLPICLFFDSCLPPPLAEQVGAFRLEQTCAPAICKRPCQPCDAQPEDNETLVDIALSAASIPENAGVGAVVGTLSVPGQNINDTFTYTLIAGNGDTDNEAFNILGDQVRAAENFNFDVKNSYSIRVRAANQDALFFERTFTITVAPLLSTHSTWRVNNSSTINIAVLEQAHSDWAYDTVVSAEIKVAGQGIKKNGGVLLNHRKFKENGFRRAVYHAVLLDVAAQELQVYRFDGKLLIKENQIDVAATLNRWYRVSAAVRQEDGATMLTATVYDVENENAVIAEFVTPIQQYEVVDGRPGIIADRSITYFNSFRLEPL